MLDNLKKMALFATVVESNGFSGAARKLGLTRSAVSRQIAALEQGLGVRLLNRTTRRLSLTEAGETYYESCARIVAEAELAEAAVSKLHGRPMGTLKISAPVIAYRLLIPLVKDFMEQHDQLSLDLSLEDRYIDLLEEGIDLALRIGHPSRSGLISRRLMPVSQVVCGSPGYLERHGEPRVPDDLASHHWVTYSLLASPNRFVFTGRDGSQRTVRVSGKLRVNGGPAIREALLQGVGLSMMPAFYVDDDLRAGRLRAVLTDFEAKRTALFAVYPHKDQLSTKVRLFVDFLKQRL